MNIWMNILRVKRKSTIRVFFVAMLAPVSTQLIRTSDWDQNSGVRLVFRLSEKTQRKTNSKSEVAQCSATPPEEDWAMATGDLHTKFHADHSSGSRHMLVDRQTDRQTGWSQYSAPLSGWSSNRKVHWMIHELDNLWTELSVVNTTRWPTESQTYQFRDLTIHRLDNSHTRWLVVSVNVTVTALESRQYSIF